MPETVICAHEFISLPCPETQKPALEELRALVAPSYPEMTAASNKVFWNRKPGLVKAHLLVLAHMDGKGSQIPKELWEEYRYVIGKSPLLAEEVHRIALYPRPPLGCGWASPAIAAVETMQCLAQCISPAYRRCAPSTKGGGIGDAAPLLQLPHFGVEQLRALRRAKPRGIAGAGGSSGALAVAFGAAGGAAGAADATVGPDGQPISKSQAKKQQQQLLKEQAEAAAARAELTVRDLQAMDDVARSELLGPSGAGLSAEQADEASAFLQALPEVALIPAPFEVDGEEGVCERDPVKLRVRALLRRPAHDVAGYNVKGRAVRALRQHPEGLNAPPREEGWYALLIDPSRNAVFSACSGPRVNLIEAERAALARPDAFAAAAAAMARRFARAPAGMQAIARGPVVTWGGASAVGAEWERKRARRRAAARLAAVAAAEGEEAEEQEKEGGGSGNGGLSAKQLRQQQQRRAGSAGGGGGKKGSGGGAAGGDGDDSDDEDGDSDTYEGQGQPLELVFMAPPEGTYNLLLLLLSDTYVGADVAVPLRLVVTKEGARQEAAEAAAALAAGAAAAAGAKKKASGRADDESELTTGLLPTEADVRSGGGDGDDDDDDEDDEDSYDSEETGSMETGPESSKSGSGEESD
jgi:hypothetical protein